MSTVPRAYRDEVIKNSASTFIGKQASLVGPTWTQDFNLIPAIPGEKMLAVLCEAQVALTASATVATVAGTDQLDEALDQLQIKAAPNGAIRTYLLSRTEVEETERLAFDLARKSYPRSAPHSFTSSTTAFTEKVQFLFPVGGDGGTLKIHVPNITGVYTASVTASVTWIIRGIYGTNDTIVTAVGKQGVPVSGKFDVSPQFPADMSPDFVAFVGDTTTSITAFFITSQDGGQPIADFDTPESIQFTQDLPAPDTTFTYSLLALALRRKRIRNFLVTYSSSENAEFLFLEFHSPSGETANVAATPAPTAVPAASQQVGQVLPGNAGVTPGPGTGGRLGAAPAASPSGGGIIPRRR